MKKFYTTVVFVFIITAVFSQSKLTPKELLKQNYQEVIGNLNKKTPDSLIPDIYAKYPDGLQGVQEHIRKNMRYLVEAYKNGIQGKVVLKFNVDIDGEITDIEILRSVHNFLHTEAKRVLKTFKAWEPGYKNGKPIKLTYSLPFNFKI